MLRPRTSPAHWLMNATKRESQPVRPAVSNSTDFTDSSLLKVSRTTSTPGSVGPSRQLPDTLASNTPGDVRTAARFGMEAVVFMGLPLLNQRRPRETFIGAGRPQNKSAGPVQPRAWSWRDLFGFEGDGFGLFGPAIGACPGHAQFQNSLAKGGPDFSAGVRWQRQ